MAAGPPAGWALTAGLSCDEADDEFDCGGNDDCPNDQEFCNGSELCVAGECISAGNPCAAGEACDETDDICRPDCNTNGTPDHEDVMGGTSPDCNRNGTPDECDIADGFSEDCQPNGRPDECELGEPNVIVLSAVSRKNCDLPLLPPRKSEPRQGGVTQVRITFNAPPGCPGANPVTIQQATCAEPAFVPYAGEAVYSANTVGNELVLTFAPALENNRTYLIELGDVTSIAGQVVPVRGLISDVNSDGRVNAVDRSEVVAAWTSSGFSCKTDINSDGTTNAIDRSLVVGAWTGSLNCAP